METQTPNMETEAALASQEPATDSALATPMAIPKTRLTPTASTAAFGDIPILKPYNPGNREVAHSPGSLLVGRDGTVLLEAATPFEAYWTPAMLIVGDFFEYARFAGGPGKRPRMYTYYRAEDVPLEDFEWHDRTPPACQTFHHFVVLIADARAAGGHAFEPLKISFTKSAIKTGRDWSVQVKQHEIKTGAGAMWRLLVDWRKNDYGQWLAFTEAAPLDDVELSSRLGTVYAAAVDSFAAALAHVLAVDNTPATTAVKMIPPVSTNAVVPAIEAEDDIPF